MAASRLINSWHPKWFRRKTIIILASIVFLCQLCFVVYLYSSEDENHMSEVNPFSSLNRGGRKLHLSDFKSQGAEDVNFFGSFEKNATTVSPKSIEELFQGCPALTKEATSAVSRAKTDACKIEIRNITCLAQQNKLAPSFLPRYCKGKGTNNVTQVGCFKVTESNPGLKESPKTFEDSLTLDTCIYMCVRYGFYFAGLSKGNLCSCGNGYTNLYRMPQAKCTTPCSGDQKPMCGGDGYMNIYLSGIGQMTRIKPRIPTAEEVRGVTPARIAFVLTLNGRALRQVWRLFKLIYHVDHYYFIHVDSRQDFLFRELLPLEEAFPNVRLARTRLSTIWGGASLLQMQMMCMAQLLAMDDWTWDTFINLSESDFPIKKFSDLIAYFTANKGMNFVKSHGTNTQKFIQKQGLEKVFHECDNHMWRLADRKLPDNIRVDGGSDWVSLSYEMCRYIVYGDDPMVEGLKRVWQQTLLPSESFYHTLLWNSRFCEKYVDNNLHITNWKRKQGCKCQYKHIVDWCGCSPNDFYDRDFSRFESSKTLPVYFARKFEAVISQTVINHVDFWLYGEYPKGTPSMNVYWENVYHVEDTQPTTDDHVLTFYTAFSDLSTSYLKQYKSCSFVASRVVAVSIYLVDDVLQGLIVRYEAENTGSGDVSQMETHLTWTHSWFNHIVDVGNTSRLMDIQVGSHYDLKEEMFRNHGRLLGPQSDVKARLVWGRGGSVSFKTVWVSPSNFVAGIVHDDVAEGGDNVTHVGITLQKPLQPGKWQVRLMIDQVTIAETTFLVAPLKYLKGSLVSEDTAAAFYEANRGAPPADNARFRRYELQLDLVPAQGRLQAEAEANARRINEELDEWLGELVGEFWKVGGVCGLGTAGASCRGVDPCSASPWSTEYPDPKSFVSPKDINETTGRLRP